MFRRTAYLLAFVVAAVAIRFLSPETDHPTASKAIGPAVFVLLILAPAFAGLDVRDWLRRRRDRKHSATVTLSRGR